MASSTLASTALLCLINFLFFGAGAFLNSVVIISIRRSSQLRKKLCYFTIFLLSCTDLAVVVIVHPSIAWMSYSQIQGKKYKINEIIFFKVFFFVQGFSALMLLTLNVERFLAIKFPFFHETQVTKKRLMAFTVILACFPLFLEILLWLKIIRSTVFIGLPLISIALVYLNYEMYKIAKSKRRRIPSTTSKNKCRKKSQKTLSTFLVVLCLMLFTLPRAALSAYTNNALQTSTLENNLLFHLELWSSTIMVMNSSFNTVVFFWKNSVLRFEGLKIVKKLHFWKE